jgi:predicted Zn-dependent peptidase
MNTKNFDPYDFSEREIDGVKIYYKNLPTAPCIHIRVVFNTGAFDDPIGKEGLSHFLEHMIFDGCPSLPDKKAIKEWAKLHTLNTWNAWTDFDNTCYWFKCLPEEYDKALSGMKDMIFNSYLRAEDVEHERKVITQEAWNRFLNEKYLKYCKEFVDNIFHGHNHGRLSTALGWPDTIEKISVDDIKNWHKNNYGLGNFFIVLAGAVEEKHIDGLKNFLKDLPKVNETVKSVEELGKPKNKRFEKTADEIGQVKEQVEISMLRVAGKRNYSENEINGLVGRLLYDLLFERLRIENSLCYGVNVGGWMGKTYSQMSMNVKTEEKNIKLVEQEFKKAINEIIDKKHISRFDLIKKMYIEQLKSAEFLSGDVADDTVNELSRFEGHIVTQKEQLEEGNI